MSQHIVLAGPAAETTRLIAFWVLAILAVAAALGMILARRAVHCALMLAVVMLSLAVMYAMLGAPFLAFVQVIVYTGAVLMLFLFVLMIVGITAADSVIETLRGQRLWAGIGGIGAARPAWRSSSGNAVIGPAAPNSAQFGNSNVTDLAAPDLHQVRLPVRAHQRAAHHGRAGRHGARAPRADFTQAHPAGTGPAASRQRPASPAARSGHLRPAQRGGHARPAARRHASPGCR